MVAFNIAAVAYFATSVNFYVISLALSCNSIHIHALLLCVCELSDSIDELGAFDMYLTNATFKHRFDRKCDEMQDGGEFMAKIDFHNSPYFRDARTLGGLTWKSAPLSSCCMVTVTSLGGTVGSFNSFCSAYGTSNNFDLSFFSQFAVNVYFYPYNVIPWHLNFSPIFLSFSALSYFSVFWVSVAFALLIQWKKISKIDSTESRRKKKRIEMGTRHPQYSIEIAVYYVLIIGAYTPLVHTRT